MMAIEPNNTDGPSGDRWGAWFWNNCCQAAARRVTSCFSEASDEHKKILNPLAAQMKGAGSRGVERREEQPLKERHHWSCRCPWTLGLQPKPGTDGLWGGFQGLRAAGEVMRGKPQTPRPPAGLALSPGLWWAFCCTTSHSALKGQ